MRILVCGGRYYDDWGFVSKTLKDIGPTVLIQGGAPGADRLAQKWAERNAVPVVTYPANWNAGKKGGPMRNAFMLADGRPNLVVAFPGGAGTADMIAKAEAAGVRVHRAEPLNVTTLPVVRVERG